MTSHKNRWIIQPRLSPEADAALAAYPPILRQVLFNRGLATLQEAQAFLHGEPSFDTNPLQMKGMARAVERIRLALENGESIAVYGDYDVDGVTATVLLVEFLRALGGKVREYIPNRFDEGYGLNNEALAALANDGVQLVITVDCGVRSVEEARHAQQLGLDLIITDHHEPGDNLPDVVAVINPKQAGDIYPEKHLAGVGIAYKLAEALAAGYGKRAQRLLPTFLDLVALGTVADLAPLTGENRSLVRRGLEQLRQTSRQGLFSLANVAGVNLKQVNAQTIGYVLGPRLNAAGRLESALAAFRLLITTDAQEAGDLALKLNQQNLERQKLTHQIQMQAEVLALDGREEAFLLFAVHPDFSHGVVGLAASRLVDTHYRPAVVGQYGEETSRCSCRSIPEFHITHALDECADLLVRHGGHAAAAGFTVRNENLPALIERLHEIARRELSQSDLRRRLIADAEVSLSHLTPDLFRHLERLQPTGYGNPEPVFVSRNVKITAKRQVGADGKHLKLSVTNGRITFDAIGFRLGEMAPNLPNVVDILYTFELNEYNGYTTFQLNLKDIKPSGVPD